MLRRGPIRSVRSQTPAGASRPGLFLLLVVLLTLPLWAIGFWIDIRFLPGLPLAALAVACPALVALGLTARTGGRAAARRLLARTLDAPRAGWRLVGVTLINPLLFGAAFAVARLGGTTLPLPDLSLVRTLALFAVFLATALLEEIGWTGYLLAPLRARFGTAGAALLLGLFISAWHYPALIEADRSVDWIAWWTLWSVAARCIQVQMHDWAGGSLFAVAQYHAMSNLCWQLYPVGGSFFDPRISGLITLGAVVVFALAMRRRDAAP
jgi:membrane protease YdiL (CAAX protease family)